MKEAYGGIVNLVFLVIFLVIVMGVLGLTVTYTKAYKMKDAIISIIEEYEGSGCGDRNGNVDGGSACMTRIAREATSLGYRPPSLNCGGNLHNANGLFCYEVKDVTGSDGSIDNHRAIYRVVTQIDINFPIIENIMGMSIFQVAGDTKTIELQS